MKLNFQPRHSKTEAGKSALQKLIDDAREFNLQEFLNGLRGKDKALIQGRLSYFDPKTTPEGSKDLAATEKLNVNGVPVVQFSDGSSYIDFDKLPKDNFIRKVFELAVKTGQGKFETIYKPDGTTFRKVSLATQSTAPTPAPG
jgi:hypothetical protein